MPLRVVKRDTVQDGPGGVQIVLGEIAADPGELLGVVPGVAPLVLPVAALGVGVLPVGAIAAVTVVIAIALPV